MINHLELEVSAGEKFVPGSSPLGNPENFHLYHNEFFMGHNTILTVKHDQMQVYINHNVLNFMISTDEEFCRYTYRTIQNIMRKSSLISVTNERERSKFFNNLRNVIDADMKKMAADSTTQRWWKETDACQQPLPDATSKGQIWSSMEEMFHED